MVAAYPRSDLEMVVSRTSQFWTRYAGSRVFVTGGTGLIGSWLISALQAANDLHDANIQIVALARNPDSAKGKLPTIFERADVSLLAGDICTLSGQIGKMDLCIHAAADVGDPRNAQRPIEVFDSIVNGTRKVLEFAKSNGVKRFLLTSSGAIYGAQPVNLERMDEHYGGSPDLHTPAASYGNSKRIAEWLSSAYSAKDDPLIMQTTIARIFAVIGPGIPLNGPFAAGNFIADALTCRSVQVQSDGRTIRSYMYIADVCVWLLHILGFGTPNRAYNVGSEESISVGTLANRISLIAQSNLAVELLNAPNPNGPKPARYVPDTNRARSELSLDQYTSIDDALARTISWNRMASSS